MYATTFEADSANVAKLIEAREGFGIGGAEIGIRDAACSPSSHLR